jgi:hypothetical protein
MNCFDDDLQDHLQGSGVATRLEWNPSLRTYALSGYFPGGERVKSFDAACQASPLDANYK